MQRYLVRRLDQMVPLLVLISMLVYGLLRAMPGDPLYAMLREVPSTTAEDYERLRSLYGLDEPVAVQYAKWVWQFVQGRPGYSRYLGMPVMDIVLPRLANTLILTLIAITLGQTVAILLGIYSAVRQYSPGDYLSMGLAFFGFSVPGFWLGLMLVMIFAVQLRWLPTGGQTSAELPASLLEAVLDRARYLILPVLAMAITETASTARYMRSALLEVIRQDYILTAQAKGLRPRTVLGRHALKNALIPVVTVIALHLPRVFGGSVVIETVFSYPGIGKLLYDSVMENDFNTAMAVVMLIAVAVLVFNLIADLLYAWLDPRIRYEQGTTS